MCHPRYLHLVVKREEGLQNSGHSGLISSNTMVDVGKEHAEEQQQELVVKESSVPLMKQLPCDEYSTAEPTEPSESDQILTLQCDVEEKVKKTLRINLVIRKSEFETKFEKAVGEKLSVKRLGFFLLSKSYQLLNSCPVYPLIPKPHYHEDLLQKNPPPQPQKDHLSLSLSLSLSLFPWPH